MHFLLDHLDGFVSAIALIVSILGAVISRYLTKKDMLKKQRADFNKKICYSYFDLIFDFLGLCSPEFADDILDSILDEYQYDPNLSLKSRIDKSYIEINKRKQKLRFHIIKMEAYASSDIPKTKEVLIQVRNIFEDNVKLLDIYSEELKRAFEIDNVSQVNDDLLRDATNRYEDQYGAMMEEVKKYVNEIKSQLLAEHT